MRIFLICYWDVRYFLILISLSLSQLAKWLHLCDSFLLLIVFWNFNISICLINKREWNFKFWPNAVNYGNFLSVLLLGIDLREANLAARNFFHSPNLWNRWNLCVRVSMSINCQIWFQVETKGFCSILKLSKFLEFWILSIVIFHIVCYFYSYNNPGVAGNDDFLIDSFIVWIFVSSWCKLQDELVWCF